MKHIEDEEELGRSRTDRSRQYLLIRKKENMNTERIQVEERRMGKGMEMKEWTAEVVNNWSSKGSICIGEVLTFAGIVW